MKLNRTVKPVENSKKKIRKYEAAQRVYVRMVNYMRILQNQKKKIKKKNAHANEKFYCFFSLF